MTQLRNLEQVDYNYSHEFRLNNQANLTTEHEALLTDFVGVNFPKHVCFRTKFNLIKSLKMKLV